MKGPGLKLGVTGGIGSGKTSVCKVFNVLGIPVFSADRIARDIMDSDEDIIKKINSVTGKDLYSNGFLDRMALAALIFNNSDMLHKVNSLVHPIVFDHFATWEKNQSAPYVIMEAAILFESGASKLVDRIATVVAPEEERVTRLTIRSKLSRQQVLDRMKNQMNDEERIKLSDYVIYNSENDMVIPAILEIHKDILKSIGNVN
ncbi:MAG: dephospho-CoA kinase [Bacteroidales bacterium]|nr:dephospho-CoA kinase [Bacteroidales bacterium]